IDPVVAIEFYVTEALPASCRCWIPQKSPKLLHQQLDGASVTQSSNVPVPPRNKRASDCESIPALVHGTLYLARHAPTIMLISVFTSASPACIAYNKLDQLPDTRFHISYGARIQVAHFHVGSTKKQRAVPQPAHNKRPQ